MGKPIQIFKGLVEQTGSKAYSEAFEWEVRRGALSLSLLVSHSFIKSTWLLPSLPRQPFNIRGALIVAFKEGVGIPLQAGRHERTCEACQLANGPMGTGRQ